MNLSQDSFLSTSSSKKKDWHELNEQVKQEKAVLQTLLGQLGGSSDQSTPLRGVMVTQTPKDRKRNVAPVATAPSVAKKPIDVTDSSESEQDMDELMAKERARAMNSRKILKFSFDDDEDDTEMN